MSDFTIANLDTRNLDTYKRVNYEHGMVLGVDEFLQEEIYLLGRDRRHNRGLHGYGTLCGLAVEADETVDDGWKIIVHSGIGVNPRGQEIRVRDDQCALLENWLRSTDESVPESGAVSLYVVLCYRECKTDLVPVPTGPCQSLEETTVASRIADDFELRLSLHRPGHIEAQVIRHLFDGLNAIPVTSDPTNFSEQELADYIRSFTPQPGPSGSPPTSPPVESWEIDPPPAFMPGSPPLAPNLNVSDARDYIRMALRVWVTEVKPRLLAGDKNCVGGPPDETCLLLAELNFDLTAGAVSSAVTVVEDDRPYLVSTRALQEQMLNRAAVSPGGAGVSSHSGLSDLVLSDDHSQYLHIDGRRPLDADLSAGTHRITNLGPATAPDEAVRLSQLDDAIASHAHAEFLMHNGDRDLTGDLSANGNKITSLAPATDPGDALSLGVAENSFVGAEAGPYRVVAAGRFLLASGNSIGPVYNGLSVTPFRGAPDILNLQFRGYQNPNTAAARRRFAYILRASFEGVDARLSSAVVQLIGFGNRREGIFVRVVPNQASAPTIPPGFPLEAAEIADPGISVEICQIEVPSP